MELISCAKLQHSFTKDKFLYRKMGEVGIASKIENTLFQTILFWMKMMSIDLSGRTTENAKENGGHFTRKCPPLMR